MSLLFNNLQHPLSVWANEQNKSQERNVGMTFTSWPDLRWISQHFLNIFTLSDSSLIHEFSLMCSTSPSGWHLRLIFQTERESEAATSSVCLSLCACDRDTTCSGQLSHRKHSSVRRHHFLSSWTKALTTALPEAAETSPDTSSHFAHVRCDSDGAKQLYYE